MNNLSKNTHEENIVEYLDSITPSLDSSTDLRSKKDLIISFVNEFGKNETIEENNDFFDQFTDFANDKFHSDIVALVGHFEQQKN